MKRDRSKFKIHWATLVLLAAAMGLTFMAYRRTEDHIASPVYLVTVRGTISSGTAEYLRRALRDAEANKARAVVLELSTFGGEINAMKEMGEIIDASPVPVDTFVDGKAISAGAYIALAGRRVIMTPAAVMGASQPRRIDGQPLPEKELSAFRNIFRAQAEARARNLDVELDPLVAEAMVDPEIEIPGITEKGRLLTLTAKRAVELGYADSMANNRSEALAQLELNEARLVVIQPTPAEGLVRFLTDPYVAPILLTIGFTALLIEIFTAGFGIAGIVGVSSILLFFGARILSGLAGVEVLFLFLLGIILLILELFIAGFGVAGILGLISIGGSVFLSFSNSQEAWFSLGLAVVWTLVLMVFSLQLLGKSGLMGRIALRTALSRDEGYTAVPGYEDYVGKEGTVSNTLRPAGVGVFEDERLDIVSEGDYILPGTKVRIIRVEGRRIVVRPIE